MRYLSIPLLALALACAKESQPAPAAAATDNRAADEAKIRGLDSAWAKAAASKNPDSAITVYADNASMFGPGEPLATGKTALRAAWAGMLGLPGAVLTFAPDKIDVSGDRAIDVGTYTFTVNDKAG